MASNLLFTLFTLGYLALIIFLAVKRKMHLASFFTLLKISIGPLITCLILMYSMPQDKEIIGNGMPYIPFFVGLIIIIMAVIVLKLPKKETRSAGNRSLILGWILFLLGVTVQFAGLSFVLMSFFAPPIFNSVNPVPGTGVPGFICFTVAGCLMLYLSSKTSTASRPNLFRWIVFFTILLFFDQATVIGLILIYAIPSQPPATYPYLSSINTLSHLPFALAIFLLAKDYNFKQADS